MAIVLIGEDILTSATTKLEVSGFAQSYKDLLCIAKVRTDRATENTDAVHLNVGNGTVDTGVSAYAWRYEYVGDTSANGQDNADTKVYCGLVNGNDSSPSVPNAFSIVKFWIGDYADTGANRPIQGHSTQIANTIEYKSEWFGQWRDTASGIDIIRLVPETATNFMAGSFLRVYGLGD